MNKQEVINKQALIDELMKIPGVGSNSDALKTIKRFPSYKPQKVKVPKCVGELLDYYRNSTDVELWALLITFKDWYYRKDKAGKDENAIDWLVKHPEKYMRAWLDGYEVDEEPKYTVSFEGKGDQLNYRIALFGFNSHGKPCMGFSKRNNLTPICKDEMLTESEIKSYDERLWTFAVPVDGGVEEV